MALTAMWVCLLRVIVLFVLTFCTCQALVSDMTSNAAFAGVTMFNLVIFNEETHCIFCIFTLYTAG